jgi:hypothetical protein
MDIVSTISSSTLDAAPRSRPVLQVTAIGALAATVANVALWASGRAADVDFVVSPPVGDLDIQVGVVLVGPDHPSRVRRRLGRPRAGRSTFPPVGARRDGRGCRRRRRVRRRSPVRGTRHRDRRTPGGDAPGHRRRLRRDRGEGRLIITLDGHDGASPPHEITVVVGADQ